MNVNLVDFLELFNKDIQYSVPRWQRRYSWNKLTIEQLIKDLETIARVDDEHAKHFGGTLITYSEKTPLGSTDIYHVVDGQQRLTTISILLICIAVELKEKGSTQQWSSRKIREAFLENRMQPRTKLRLQDRDNEAYQRILQGHSVGDGKIAESWKILRKAVTSVGPDNLMRGLSRLRVISFTCKSSDDPQQIFESLNATGIALTEGEKVKNWLLMGMDNVIQEELYNDYWCKIETSVGGLSDPKRIDEFLRDFLRLKTGENYGMKLTYTNLRRWWYSLEGTRLRDSLCQELARLAGIYGKITGTNGQHQNAEVSDLLRHLRSIGLDVQRPFTLRLLDDATKPEITGAYEGGLIEALQALSTWLTRIWLSAKPTAGLNTEFAQFAHQHIKIAYHESYADYWIKEIQKLRYSRIAVPNENEIGEGLMRRKAYGGKVTDATKSILWTINYHFGGKSINPRIEDVSIEHIMPRTLSKEWKEHLGEDADDLHATYKDILPNLTLVGKGFGPEISNRIFKLKQEYYQRSDIWLTRQLSESHQDWNEEDLIQRGRHLIELILQCWPWENVSRAKIRWRIGQNSWNDEKKYSQMLLNVVASLLDADHKGNSELLLGHRISKDIFLSGTEPKGKGRFQSIPKYPKYVMNLNFNRSTIVNLCKDMSRRCGCIIDIEYIKSHNGGLPEWEKEPPNISDPRNSKPRWRIGDGVWRSEKSYQQMLVNVVSALLDLDFQENFSRLSGSKKTRDLQYSHIDLSQRDYTKIPRYSKYVIYTNLTRDNIIAQCRELCERCTVLIEID